MLTGALRKAARPCVAVRLSNASPHFSEIFTGARFLGPRKALKQLQAAADCTTHSSRQACRQVITVAQWCTAYARMVPQLCSPLATKSSLVPVPTVMMMMMKALWVRAPFGAPRAYLVTACFSQLGLFRQWRVSILLPALAGLSGSYIMCACARAPCCLRAHGFVPHLSVHPHADHNACYVLGLHSAGLGRSVMQNEYCGIPSITYFRQHAHRLGCTSFRGTNSSAKSAERL